MTKFLVMAIQQNTVSLFSEAECQRSFTRNKNFLESLDRWCGEGDENDEKDLKVSPCLSGGTWGIVREVGPSTGFDGIFF